MAIKIVTTGDDHEVPESIIREMVEAYRRNPQGGEDSNNQQAELTRFAHFPIHLIVKFLVKNGIVNTTDSVQQLMDNTKNGLKVYFAQHGADERHWPNAPFDYKGRNSVVLVCTHLDDAANVWNDMLSENSLTETYALTTAFDDGNSEALIGTGLDKTSMCPPQCGQFGETL